MTRFLRNSLWALLTFAVGATSASAETLLMPPRDFAGNQNEVVWGITTQANNTAYAINFGDGSATQTGTITGAVGDRSYINFTRQFPPSNVPYTVTLCVGPGAALPVCPGETATTQVRVFDTAVMSASDVRKLNINRAIEDGLRYFWVSQSNRTTFDSNNQTIWTHVSFTGLVVLAYMNHGYNVPNDQSTPVGIYQKYAVQRGLNYILANLQSFASDSAQQPPNTPYVATYNPCEGIGAGTQPCTLFYQNQTPGYSTSIAILPFAGSNALDRMSTIAGITNGRTYRDILQRLVNGLAWGQNESPNNVCGTGNNHGRGGWNYGFNECPSDGSTIGWNMLALLDSAAAGVNAPGFVKPEFTQFAYTNAKNFGSGDPNVDGTYDYNANSNSNSAPLNHGGANVYRNTARVGIGLQAAFYTGAPLADPYVQAALTAANYRWNLNSGAPGDYTSTCFSGQNKSCAYAMFNLFKGLRLYGVTTLPTINGGNPGDWYADYVDYLVNNQQIPQTNGGGYWTSGAGTNRFGGPAAAMGFSCCDNSTHSISAVAELILANTALIQPDPVSFGQVGLQHGNPLTTGPDTNAVGTLHTVVARVTSQGGAPIPGVPITFQILAGSRNAGVALAGGVSDANGVVSASYTDQGLLTTGGTDNIRAFINNGVNGSNTLVKNWIVPVTTIKCDADSSGRIDLADLKIIASANGQVASGPNDPRDGNGDGAINVLDGRYCQLAMAKQPPVQ